MKLYKRARKVLPKRENKPLKEKKVIKQFYNFTRRLLPFYSAVEDAVRACAGDAINAPAQAAFKTALNKFDYTANIADKKNEFKLAASNYGAKQDFARAFKEALEADPMDFVTANA